MSKIEKLLAESETLEQFCGRAFLHNGLYADEEERKSNPNTLALSSTSLLGAIASGTLDKSQRAAIDLIHFAHTGETYFVEKCRTTSI